MTDKSIPAIPAGVLSDEQIAKISGGTCTTDDYLRIIGDLQGAYESLVGFTSYVIERVATSVQ